MSLNVGKEVAVLERMTVRELKSRRTQWDIVAITDSFHGSHAGHDLIFRRLVTIQWIVFHSGR